MAFLGDFKTEYIQGDWQKHQITIKEIPNTYLPATTFPALNLQKVSFNGVDIVDKETPLVLFDGIQYALTTGKPSFEKFVTNLKEIFDE